MKVLALVEAQQVSTSLDVVLSATAAVKAGVFDASVQTYYTTADKERQRLQFRAQVDGTRPAIELEVRYTCSAQKLLLVTYVYERITLCQNIHMYVRAQSRRHKKKNTISMKLNDTAAIYLARS